MIMANQYPSVSPYGGSHLLPGLVNIQKPTWKMAIEMVDLLIYPLKIVIVHSYVNVYQRVV